MPEPAPVIAATFPENPFIRRSSSRVRLRCAGGALIVVLRVTNLVFGCPDVK